MTAHPPRVLLALMVLVLGGCSASRHSHSPGPNSSSVPKKPPAKGVYQPATTSVLEVPTLRDQCKNQGVNGPEVQKADSLVTASRAYKQEGRKAEAELTTELAAAYYRLALSKTALQKSQERISELRKSLSTAQGQLRTYKEVLYEIETIK